MTTPPEPPVLYQETGHVGVITLNRPDNRNSMTADLLDAFAAEIARLRDRDLRCLVITGRGSCFSGGADLTAMVQRQTRARPMQPHERSHAMYEPFMSVLDVEVPVIAAMSGHAVGGGFGLALLCDIRIAARTAKYGANFTKLGIHPGLAVSYVLPRLIGVSRAAELLFTGRLFDGTEAAALGVASEALPAAEVMPRALALAEQIAANAPIAVRMTKRSLYESLDWRPRDAALREAFAQAVTLDTADAREGMAALLEKRQPRFRDE